MARRDTETSEFIEDLQAQIRDLNKANEALKNKVTFYWFLTIAFFRTAAFYNLQILLLLRIWKNLTLFLGERWLSGS